MSLAALSLRGRGTPVVLRPKGAATREARGVLATTSEADALDEGEAVVKTTTLTLSAVDGAGLKRGDAVDAGGQTWRVSAALQNDAAVELRLKRAA